MTTEDKLKLVSQLGIIEGIKAGLLDSSAAVAALTPVTTADATDLPTAEALANELKAKVNQIIAALNA